MNQAMKVAGMAVAGCMAAGLTACGAEKAPEASTPVKTNGKAIVVYYSASGCTARAARIIANEAGADLFEVKLADPYTDADLNYRNSSSRVCREHDDASLRHMTLAQKTPENWDQYTTVFVGYPIWWAIAAWPLSSFVEQNDFAGKTVILFATSYSSGFGESGELLRKAAGTGDWKQGERFYSQADEAELRAWVHKVL